VFTKISIYTSVRNGIFGDYHVVDMLKHHLPLADEIVVNEGYSSDHTYEKISQISDKIKIVRTHWNDIPLKTWFSQFKNYARQQCTGDWCILLDPDEFIPEWEFDKIKAYLKTTSALIVPLKFTHFYGNYKVYLSNPEKFNWFLLKCSIHKNIDSMEVVGDGSNVKYRNTNGELTELDSNSKIYAKDYFEAQHFGTVKKASRLRQKFSFISVTHSKAPKWRWALPSFVFDIFPYNWLDPEFLDDLAIYEGPLIKAVRENPDEFVRDSFKLYHYLANRARKPENNR